MASAAKLPKGSTRVAMRRVKATGTPVDHHLEHIQQAAQEALNEMSTHTQDDWVDGATFKRVAGVNASNQATASSIASGVAASNVGTLGGDLSGTLPNPHINRGTSFPGAPATNDIFFRTDDGILYYYDGTRWVSFDERYVSIPSYDTGVTGTPANVTTNGIPLLLALPTYRSGHIYLTNWEINSRVVSLNSGTVFWTTALTNLPGTVIATRNTSGDGAGDTGWKLNKVAVNSDRTVATDGDHYINVTKTGAPGVLQLASGIYYRVVG